MGSTKTRTEHDLIGNFEVPADAYYGVQTARALENFQISGIPISHYPGFIEAWAIVKLAAARANTDVGAMKKETLDAIEKAADALRRSTRRAAASSRTARWRRSRRCRSRCSVFSASRWSRSRRGKRGGRATFHGRRV